MTTTERRIEELEAMEDIRRLKIRYAELCDSDYDPERLTALFTEDALWDSGPYGSCRGHDEIRAYWERTRDQFPFALHYVTNHRIDVDLDTATAVGTSYVWAPVTMEEQALWLAVTYDERYRREGHQWLFAAMLLRIEFMCPYEEGWVKHQLVSRH